MRNKKHQNRIQSPHQDRSLRLVAYVVTILWVLFGLFPMFWLISTSMQDSSVLYSDEISLLPKVPYAYSFEIEYTQEQWEEDGEILFKTDASILNWVTHEHFPKSKIGRTNVYAVVDGSVVASSTLTESKYTLYRNNNFDVIEVKSEHVIRWLERVLKNDEELVKPYTWNLNEKMPGGLKTNETTQEMFDHFVADENLTGTLKGVYYKSSPVDLLNNYKSAWKWPSLFAGVGSMGLARTFLNSLTVVILGVLAQWIIVGFASYALSRLVSKRTANFLMIAFLATIMIPSTVTLIPLYLEVNKLGLSNSLLGVILPSIPSAFNMFLFKNFFDNLPDSLFDAARLDGAGEFIIFFRVAMPLSFPVFGVIALFTFTGLWNDYFWSMLILTDSKKYTLPLLINSLANNSKSTFNMALSFAICILAAIPTILVYAVFQRQMQSGFVFSGNKE